MQCLDREVGLLMQEPLKLSQLAVDVHQARARRPAHRDGAGSFTPSHRLRNARSVLIP